MCKNAAPHQMQENTQDTTDNQIHVEHPPELCLLVHPHILWVLQTEPCKVLNRFGLCGGEQQGLTLSREVLHNGIECLREAHVQDTVSLIQDWSRAAQHNCMKMQRN